MSLRAVVATIGALLLAPSMHAGVTIHYEGTVRSASDVAAVVATARSFAKQYGWKVEDASAEHRKHVRVGAEKNEPYEGKLTGIVFYPAELCEPVWLQFGDDLFFQNYVKTQFAGADIHVAIIKLFDQLKPLLKSLRVDDDGGYWEKRDRSGLDDHFAKSREMLRQMKREEPMLYGPIKLPDGRIVDLIR